MKHQNIDLKYLRSLEPCRDRLANYIEHYRSFNGTMIGFLDLPLISCQDKFWVFLRTVPKEWFRFIAVDFAEASLHVFEDKHPDDPRPRLAIEAARRGAYKTEANLFTVGMNAKTAAHEIVPPESDPVAGELYPPLYAALAASYAAFATKEAFLSFLDARKAALYAQQSMGPEGSPVLIEIMKKWSAICELSML